MLLQQLSGITMCSGVTEQPARQPRQTELFADLLLRQESYPRQERVRQQLLQQRPRFGSANFSRS